jgi:hypothetical protein
VGRCTFSCFVQPFRALHNGVWTNVPQMDAVPESRERDESRVKSHREGIKKMHVRLIDDEEHACLDSRRVTSTWRNQAERLITYACLALSCTYRGVPATSYRHLRTAYALCRVDIRQERNVR